MPAVAALVHQQTSSSGTSELALFAVTGRRTFAEAFGTGPTTNVFPYFACGQSDDVWEYGYGHLSNATTLVRDTILKSSNANAAVDFPGSLVDIMSDIPPENQVRNEGSTNADGDLAVMDGPTGRKIKSGGGRYQNRTINAQLSRAQAGVGSITDGNYSGIDQWYVLTQTAAVASSQLTAVADGVPSMGRLTQSQATAQRFGWAQPFESSFVSDLRSKTVTLAAKVRMSAATTLRYAIIEWTGTADTITKDVVASWTNTTFTTGQFFSGTSLTIAGTGSIALAASTLTDISLSASISSSMNNLIIFFWTDSAQAQNVTLDIGNVFFGQGASAPAIFDPPSPAADFQACLRYYCKTFPVGSKPGDNVTIANSVTLVVAAVTGFAALQWFFPTRMRATPTIGTYNPGTAGTAGYWRNAGDTTSSQPLVTNVGDVSVQIYLNNAVSTTYTSQGWGIHITADARL